MNGILDESSLSAGGKKKTSANVFSSTLPASGSPQQTNGTNNYMSASLNKTNQAKSPPPAPPPSSIAQATTTRNHNYNHNHSSTNNAAVNNNNNAVSPPPPPPPPPPPVSKPNEYFNARVLYTYIPVNSDELPIQENDIVQVIRLVRLRFCLFINK